MLKKIIFVMFTIISFNVYALEKDKFIDVFTEFKSKIVFKNKESSKNINKYTISDFINDGNCSILLKNNGFYDNCYSYKYKGSVFGFYKLDGSLVNSKNIDERPNFYTDKNIPKKYISESKDYTNSGFDRSHAIANDASFDYDLRSQKSTYTMSNILPHYPNTNRKSILAVEKYERLIASKLGYINAFVVNFYSSNPKKIGKNQISIPDGIGRMYWNEDAGFEKCFYIKNDNLIYSIKETVVDCSEIFELSRKMLKTI